MQNLYFYKNKSVLALIIFLSISLSLMFFNVKLKAFNIGSIFLFVTYPIEYSVSSIGSFFADSFRGITKIRQLESELDFTKERLIKYQETLSLYNQINKENEDLRNSLEMKGRIPHTTHYARIVFRDPNLTGDYFIVDKGAMDGIHENMPVVSYNSDGQIFLVGKTTEVNVSASKVLLITAVDSYVGVTLRTSGYIGILKGMGSWNQNLVLEYIPVEANTYIGEDVVTSGESDIFPPNISIGKIVGIGYTGPEEFFKKLFVKQDNQFSKLKDVFIIEWKSGVDVKDLIENTGENK
jgi:rod shape-determining protein MreC